MSELASTPLRPSAGAAQPVRIASRKSELALAQTYWVMGQLQAHHPGLPLELHTLSTQGDIILDVALAKIGDKGLFTKELEVSLLNGSSDLAVHSLKDLPTRLPEGLVLGAITQREDPLDALVLREELRGYQLATLPEGTVIGTSSLRRLAQLRHAFPHLHFKDVRGNLNTRLAKLERGEYDGLILAVAGLKRLGKADRIHEVLDPSVFLYAVGQGSLGSSAGREMSGFWSSSDPWPMRRRQRAVWPSELFCGLWKEGVKCPSASTAKFEGKSCT